MRRAGYPISERELAKAIYFWRFDEPPGKGRVVVNYEMGVLPGLHTDAAFAIFEEAGEYLWQQTGGRAYFDMSGPLAYVVIMRPERRPSVVTRRVIPVAALVGLSLTLGRVFR